jgi:hypothetical protein
MDQQRNGHTDPYRTGNIIIAETVEIVQKPHRSFVQAYRKMLEILAIKRKTDAKKEKSDLEIMKVKEQFQ